MGLPSWGTGRPTRAQKQTMATHFPGALPEARYVARSARQLRKAGFSKRQVLACTGVCRDEISQSFVTEVQNHWGPSFALTGLAGLLYAGQTGFGAASHHAPASQREQFVFYGMTHIGLDEDGTPGRCNCRRQGRSSTSCGALVAFQGELEAGPADLSLNEKDSEMSALRQRLAPLFNDGTAPDIITLTKTAHQAIADDMAALAAHVLDPQKADYAIFTGIQLNLSNGNYIFPGTAFALRKGERLDLLPAA